MSKDLIASEKEAEVFDVSQLTNIKDQKECCDEMLKILFDEQERIRRRLYSVQTIYDILEFDVEMKMIMSEYVGYQYGIIGEAMKMFELSYGNLQRILTGSLDSIDSSARGMYITIWYNLALDSVCAIDEGHEVLLQTEADMIERIMNEDENATMLRGSFH